MSEFPFLSVVTFLPLAGALMVLVFSGDDPIAVRNIRWTSLWVTIFTFIASLIVWAQFEPGNPGFQLEERHEWIGFSAYHMGVDGISLPLLL